MLVFRPVFSFVKWNIYKNECLFEQSGVILCDRCECVVFPLLQLLQHGGGYDPLLAVTILVSHGDPLHHTGHPKRL